MLIGFSTGVCAINALADEAPWRAEEAVEEAWIRDQHSILLQEAPAAASAAEIDLALQLEELKRKNIQLRAADGWQRENKATEERIRQLSHSLKRHPQQSLLARAKARLWKTPQYKEAYRRYCGRLQEVRQMYDEPADH
jgi:hypothetical protein